VSRLSGKLGLYGRMGGTPAVTPQWEAAPSAAPPAAAPLAEVAASGAGRASGLPSSLADNPALEGLKRYVNSAFENKVYASHFSRQIAAAKN